MITRRQRFVPGFEVLIGNLRANSATSALAALWFVPQMSHSDLQKGHSKAHDAHYALVNFLGIFATVEDKGSLG